MQIVWIYRRGRRRNGHLHSRIPLRQNDFICRIHRQHACEFRRCAAPRPLAHAGGLAGDVAPLRRIHNRLRPHGLPAAAVCNHDTGNLPLAVAQNIRGLCVSEVVHVRIAQCRVDGLEKRHGACRVRRERAVRPHDYLAYQLALGVCGKSAAHRELPCRKRLRRRESPRVVCGVGCSLRLARHGYAVQKNLYRIRAVIALHVIVHRDRRDAVVALLRRYIDVHRAVILHSLLLHDSPHAVLQHDVRVVKMRGICRFARRLVVERSIVRDGYRGGEESILQPFVPLLRPKAARRDDVVCGILARHHEEYARARFLRGDCSRRRGEPATGHDHVHVRNYRQFPCRLAHHVREYV